MATPEEILETAGKANGRVSFVRREMLRLLRAELPPTIALQNAREPDNLLKAPTDFLSARLPKKSEKFPLVMVGVSSGRTLSPGRMNFRTVTAMVYVVDRAVEIEAQLSALSDTAELIEALFAARQGFHCLPDGRKVWNECKWQSTSQLPEGWPEYSGAAIEFEIGQWGLDLWTPVVVPPLAPTPVTPTP